MSDYIDWFMIIIVTSNININTKKRKMCDEHRLFNYSWVDLYFFIEHKGGFSFERMLHKMTLW